MSPINMRPDGMPKTREEIMAELRVECWQWCCEKTVRKMVCAYRDAAKVPKIKGKRYTDTIIIDELTDITNGSNK